MPLLSLLGVGSVAKLTQVLGRVRVPHCISTLERPPPESCGFLVASADAVTVGRVVFLGGRK